MPGFLRNFIFQRMQKKAGDLAAPAVTRSVGRLGLRDVNPHRFTPTQARPMRDFPGAVPQAPGLPSPPVRAPKGVSPYIVGGTAVGGGAVLGGALAATNQIEGALNQVGPAVDRFFGRITPQAIQQFGREQEKRGWGGALEMATPFGFLAAPFIPNTPAAKPRMPGLPANYKQTELDAGAAAERFRPGAGFPGQQSAAERAYQQEKSRVEQLTAQDPELKRYEDARKLAVAPGATEQQIQSAEDIGMQIWAQKNPGLAANVKPGQAGYDVIQGTLAGQAAAQGYGYQMPQQIMMTPPPGVNVPQGLPAVQSMTPTETYGAQGLEVDPEMRKKFQALLDKTAQAQ